jgi:hypothetical protein
MTLSSAPACPWWGTRKPGSPPARDSLTRINMTLSSAPACPWWGTRSKPGSPPAKDNLTRIDSDLLQLQHVHGEGPAHQDLHLQGTVSRELIVTFFKSSMSMVGARTPGFPPARDSLTRIDSDLLQVEHVHGGGPAHQNFQLQGQPHEN